MLQSLFRMLYQPQGTLEELLEERRQGRSLGATFLLTALYVLVNVILIVFVVHKLTEPMLDNPTGPDDRGTLVTVAGVEILLIGLLLLVAVVKYVLTRFVFAWIVQLGLRISAGGQYPREKSVRREKARLLRLIQPYTMWIGLLPNLLSLLALALFVGFSDVPGLTGQLDPADWGRFTGLLVGLIIWASVSQLLSLGLFMYMIVVRTMAIRKIYRISAARAFWGPFLVYALLDFVLFVLFVVSMIVIQLYGGGSTTTDLNWM